MHQKRIEVGEKSSACHTHFFNTIFLTLDFFI